MKVSGHQKDSSITRDDKDTDEVAVCVAFRCGKSQNHLAGKNASFSSADDVGNVGAALGLWSEGDTAGSSAGR